MFLLPTNFLCCICQRARHLLLVRHIAKILIICHYDDDKNVDGDGNDKGYDDGDDADDVNVKLHDKRENSLSVYPFNN